MLLGQNLPQLSLDESRVSYLFQKCMVKPQNMLEDEQSNYNDLAMHSTTTGNFSIMQ